MISVRETAHSQLLSTLAPTTEREGEREVYGLKIKFDSIGHYFILKLVGMYIF